jgi:hypothetical protein
LPDFRYYTGICLERIGGIVKNLRTVGVLAEIKTFFLSFTALGNLNIIQSHYSFDEINFNNNNN